MNQHIEQIMEDIYQIDSSLREYDQEVRKFVGLLLETKPTVVPDALFVQNLRAQILNQKEKPQQLLPVRSEYSWVWWVSRLAPVGAVAVLLLMLVNPEVKEPVPEISPAAGTMLMMQKAMNDSIYIAPQKPGTTVSVNFVSFTEGGFVAIYRNKNGSLGEMLGVSTLLGVGRSEAVSIDLFRSLKEGDEAFAALYRDNGDGVFDPQKDKPVLDSVTGEPMMMLFVATKDAAMMEASI